MLLGQQGRSNPRRSPKDLYLQNLPWSYLRVDIVQEFIFISINRFIEEFQDLSGVVIENHVEFLLSTGGCLSKITHTVPSLVSRTYFITYICIVIQYNRLIMMDLDTWVMSPMRDLPNPGWSEYSKHLGITCVPARIDSSYGQTLASLGS